MSTVDTYIRVADTIKPLHDEDFPIVESRYVSMPDDSRLSDFYNELSDISIAMELVGVAEEGNTDIEYTIDPGKYYDFSEVRSLSVTLAEAEDSTHVHEYCFEFIPADGFSGLTISPQPRWVNEPQYTVGSVCQVSILRGIAVMLSA